MTFPLDSSNLRRTAQSAVLVSLMVLGSLLVSGCQLPDLSFGSDDEDPGERSAQPIDPPDDADLPGQPFEGVSHGITDEAFQEDESIPVDPDAPRVRIGEGGLNEPRTLNPILIGDPLSEEISKLVFSGLVRLDSQSGEPEPDLASGWDISDDGTTYTFQIRENAVWHDGQPVTARDIEFTFQLMMDDRTRSPRHSRIVKRVAAVEATGEHTVEFRLLGPYSPFLSTIATFGIVPQHVLGDVLPDELVTDPFGISSAVGTGPFELTQWDRSESIRFEANASYFDEPPGVQQYEYRVLPDEDAIIEGLRDGAIDWARIDASMFAEANERDSIRGLSLRSYEMIGIPLQLASDDIEALQDPRVRQALTHALDREAFVADFWDGHAAVAHGTIPPVSWAASEPETTYAYEPERAADLLTEAGWDEDEDGMRTRNGSPLEITLVANGDNPVRRELAEAIADHWREIGVDVETDFETWGSVRDRITTTRDFEAMVLGYRWDVDPDQHAMWSSDSIQGGFNLGGYGNRNVDRLLEAAIETHDQEERARHYAEMQEMVLRDLPVIPLVFPNQTVALGPRLHDVQVTAILLRNRANVVEWVPDDVASSNEPETD